MVAATAGITPAEAARRLNDHADRHHQGPTDIAGDIVHRRTASEAVLGEPIR
ncbi:hypothetical protein [Streptomyces sp. NPDC054849]